MTEQDLFEMGLHEEISIGLWWVTRVIGGWIYSNKDEEMAVFVPFPPA